MRWFRYLDAAAGIRAHYEVDGQGAVTRHVEVRTADGRPVTAASLAEVLRLRDRADLAAMQRYEAEFGILAETDAEVWGDAPAEEISAAEFERSWRAARHDLTARQVGVPGVPPCGGTPATPPPGPNPP